MKKTISLILAVLLFICMFSNITSAANETIVETELFTDGSYGITTIYQSFSLLKAASTVTKTKRYDYYDSNNDLCWYASITATFTYNGSTSSCTSVSKAYSILDSSWRLTDSSCSRSGNTATGNFTFKHYVLGIPVKTISKTLTMTCDKNGNVA